MGQNTGRYRRRLLVNRWNLAMSLATMAFGMMFLLWILATLFMRGFEALAPALFTQMTPPPGSDGGLAECDLRQFPDGACRDVDQHADWDPRRHLPRGVRQGWAGSRALRASSMTFCCRRRRSSIGLFVYTVYVVRAQHYSGWAGSCALALLAIPVVVRTTENMLRLVPNSLREAAVALGAPMWKVILMVTLKAVRAGVITGILLAVARISGETAPLLFTALNNQFWSIDMNAPMANLPVVIFQFAMSPFKEWQQLAWAGALLITLAVLLLNIDGPHVVPPRRREMKRER